MGEKKRMMQKLVATLPPTLDSKTTIPPPTPLTRSRSCSIKTRPLKAVKVYDYLYLGSRTTLNRRDLNKRLGIDAIVDCAIEYRTIESKKPSFPFNDVQTIFLDLHDDERVIGEFRKAAEIAIDFIKTQKEQNKKVFVCCHLGTSRAAGIVLAYMMRKEDIDYSQALGKLRNLCSGTDQVILPNKWIEDLLEMWE